MACRRPSLGQEDQEAPPQKGRNCDLAPPTHLWETDSKCQGAPDPQEDPSCQVHQRTHRLTGRESPACVGDPQGTCQALLLDEVLAQQTAC